MFAAGIGLRRHMFNFLHTIMRWNFEIIPVCMPSFPTANGRTYRYGGGGALGLDFEARRQWRIAQPSIDVNFGLLGFMTQTPADTRRTNFSLQFGPGLKFPLRGRSSLKTGATFFHFSNMHTVKNNPGFDGILIYMGYSFSFEHKRSGPSGARIHWSTLAYSATPTSEIEVAVNAPEPSHGIVERAVIRGAEVLLNIAGLIVVQQVGNFQAA
jgi:hypothetical protein